MAAKLHEAIRIFAEHFGLFACLVLTLWLPANLAINFLDYKVYSEDDYVSALRLTMLLDGTIGALPLAAILMTLARIKRNEEVSYSTAMWDGLSRFIRVIVANINVGIVVGVLFFIAFLVLLSAFDPIESEYVIPSISSFPRFVAGLGVAAAPLYLLLRFALVNVVVVTEDLGPFAGMRRSYHATRGILPPILFFALFGYSAIFFIGFLLYLPLTIVEMLEWLSIRAWPQILYSSCVDSITDILMVVPTIIFFLYYWDRRWGETEHKRVANTEFPVIDSQEGFLS